MATATGGQWVQNSKDPNDWSYKGADGNNVANTWAKDSSGKYYYLDSNGKMQTNGITADGYVVGSNGQWDGNNQYTAKGWIKNADNSWGYSNGQGALATGWIKDKGKDYYIGSDNKMLANTITPDGYHVGTSGAWDNAGKDYNYLATQQYDPAYNQNIAAMKASLAAKIAAMNGQRSGINSSYDTQVSNQNLNNDKSKNNLNNAAIGRGLNRSSIVTSGLAQADQINNRVVNGINANRVSALNNLDNQISTAQQSEADQEATAAANRTAAIQSLANQLKQQDFTNGISQGQLDLSKQSEADNNKFKYDQLDFQKQQAAIDNQLKRDQLNAQKAYYSSGSGSSGSGSSSISNFVNDQLSKGKSLGDIRDYLNNNGQGEAAAQVQATINGIHYDGINSVNAGANARNNTANSSSAGMWSNFWNNSPLGLLYSTDKGWFGGFK